MKQWPYFFLALSLAFSAQLHAQTTPPFTVSLEAMVMPDAPGVQSFSWGKTSAGLWVVLGGRVDGLHRRQPWASFWEEDNNHSIYVIDPESEEVWSTTIADLPQSQYTQLQSTNQQCYQREGTLYVIGGYGYSADDNDHLTHPYLTAIDLDGVAGAVMTGTDITPFFRQIESEFLKVTGGELGLVGDTFYLIGGQLFDGLYNPMGPDMGPGFTQIYTEAIRSFQIEDDGVNLSLTNQLEVTDADNLHRRDYNMVPQIFEDGSEGFTVFTGVFDVGDMPFLDAVNVYGPSDYEVIPDFNQYLSQYHSAKLPVFDSEENEMHTLFFGGMSQFTLNDVGELVEDVNVPFVRTISRVTREADGTYSEYKLDYLEMPALLGAGAEFIPEETYFMENGILDLQLLPDAPTLVGYIYGGIESSGANIFFINDGTQSFASNTIFKVYLNPSGTDTPSTENMEAVDFTCFPNPAPQEVVVAYQPCGSGWVELQVLDATGKAIHQESFEVRGDEHMQLPVNVEGWTAGTYIIQVSQEGCAVTGRLVVK